MSLPDKLKQSTPSRGQGRHVFLAKRDEIRQALEDGYTAKEIWAFLYKKDVMPVKYRTFIEYVNRYIKADGDKDDKQPQPRSAETPPQPLSKEPQAPKESRVAKEPQSSKKTQALKKPHALKEPQAPKKTQVPKKSQVIKEEPQTEAKPQRNQFTRRFKFDARGKRKEDLI